MRYGATLPLRLSTLSANPLTAKMRLSEQKIVAYCERFAEGMAEVMSGVMMTTGKQPASFVEKMTIMGNCRASRYCFQNE